MQARSYLALFMNNSTCLGSLGIALAALSVLAAQNLRESLNDDDHGGSRDHRKPLLNLAGELATRVWAGTISQPETE